MSKERLLSSELDEVDSLIATLSLHGYDYTGVVLDHLRAEIRACWSEIELLRPIALAAAERMASHPEDETVLADAVEAWQKANREKSE